MGNNNYNLYIACAGTHVRVLSISAQKGCLLLYFLNRFNLHGRETWQSPAVLTPFALQKDHGTVGTLSVWYHQVCFYQCITARWAPNRWVSMGGHARPG